jgi:hypothetical protein
MKTFENSKGQVSSINLIEREILSSSVVAMSAEIESFLKNSLWNMYETISNESLELSNLVDGLKVIHIRLAEGKKYWKVDFKVPNGVDLNVPFSISGSKVDRAAPPLRWGQTVNTQVLELVFKYLGLDADLALCKSSSNAWSENPVSVADAIKNMSAIRNEVAHGDSLKEVFHPTKKERSVDYLLQYVQVYIDQINYMTDIFCDYLDNKKYLCC